MTDYLRQSFDWRTTEFVAVFDEAPLWSALFGQLLLDHAPLIPGAAVLDLACGAGFPLIDLAQRIGPSSLAVGLDPWLNGLARAGEKIAYWNVRQVHLMGGDGVTMPFASNAFDLITSNLGVNNFGDPAAALRECARVAKPGGKIALTTNLQGHMVEFYDIYRQTLRDLNRPDLLDALEKHVAHRTTVELTGGMLERAGFRVVKVHEQSFTMRYLDGSALLNHRFIQQAFLGAWRDVLPPQDQEGIFTCLEENLNDHAQENGGLALTIPMAYIEGKK